MNPAALLEFTEETHTYRVAGRVVTHITAVTDHFGGFADIPEAVRQRALLFGRYVHKACELDDLGVLDEDSVDAGVLHCVEQWRELKRDTGLEVLANEQRVYHPVYDYAGTLDRRVRLNGRHAIIELKTGQPYRAAGPQTAAQAMAAEACGCDQVEVRYSCHLGPNATRAVLVPHKDANDYPTFLAMLAVFRWLQAGR